MRWWVLGLCLVVLIGGIGALKWARTGQGQAVLLSLGSEKMYGDVQAAVDEALSGILPEFVSGPVGAIPVGEAGQEGTDRGGNFDWPVPHLGPGAAIRCREVTLPRGRSWPLGPHRNSA